MRVALVQMNSVSTPDSNMENVEHYFAQAAAQQAVLIAFPENFLAMAASCRVIAATDWQHYIQRLQDLCLQHHIACVAGSIPLASKEASEPRRYASCLYINEQGEVQGRYDKIHLFDADVADNVGVYRESVDYCPGKNPVVVETGYGCYGLAICFDLRFARLFNHYKQQQVRLLLIPSAFTQKTGEMHWEVLLRARAIENQCFVVAPGQTGIHEDGRKTYGHSLVVSPLGSVLADLGVKPGMAVIDLDLDEVDLARAAMPLHESLPG